MNNKAPKCTCPKPLNEDDLFKCLCARYDWHCEQEYIQRMEDADEVELALTRTTQRIHTQETWHEVSKG